MIIGTGIDMVELLRMERMYARFGNRVLKHILSNMEIAALPRMAPQYLGSRFAAKEAAVKALGTGFTGGIIPSSISINTLPSGQPQLIFSGAALAKAKELGVKRTHVSLSHERGFAIAMVILENNC